MHGEAFLEECEGYEVSSSVSGAAMKDLGKAESGAGD